jgi:FeS assembly SUF system protein
MGLFSFLSGKGGAAAEQPPNGGRSGGAGVETADSPGATEASGTPSTGASVAGASEPATAQPPRPAAGGPETPFVPPSAWDLDTAALSAPAPPPSGQPHVGPPDPTKTAALQGPIIEVIKTVYDPEIPVDIYELGLIYDIVVDAESRALVRMTLTSPACPSAQQLPSEVRYKVKAVEGVSDAAVEVVWDPPWDKDRMSDAAKLQLGFF